MATTPTPSTASRIEQAAWSLLRDGRGQEITQRAIYQAIGSRGSMTTIQQALAQWWSGLGDHLQALEYLQGFPSEALTPLLEAFAAIRELATTQARDEYETERREAQAAVETAQAEKTAALEALEQVQAERQTLRQEVDQLVERRDGLERRLRSETDRRQAVEQQIPAIREDARVRIEQAERQVGGIEAALSKEEARHQVTETRLSALYDQERTARVQEHAQAENARQALQGNLDELNQTYLQARESAAALTAELNEKVSRLSGRLEQLEAERQQWRNAEERFQAEGLRTHEALTQAETELRLTQARIREMEKACAKLETACASKDQEILRLTQQAVKQRDNKES